jgi:hypothetical protein
MNPAIPGTGSEGADPERAGTLNRLHESGVVIEARQPIVGDGFTIEVSGEYVPVGDRLVPAFLDLTLNGDASSPTCHARVEVRDDVPRIVDLQFRANPGEGDVRQAHLRATQVDAVLDLVAAFAVRVIDFDDSGGVVQTSLSPKGEVWQESIDALRRARANRKVTREFLQQVADVYKANIATGPTKAVRERFFVSPRMASIYVKQAEEAGFLSATSPGKKRA